MKISKYNNKLYPDFKNALQSEYINSTFFDSKEHIFMIEKDMIYKLQFKSSIIDNDPNPSEFSAKG